MSKLEKALEDLWGNIMNIENPTLKEKKVMYFMEVTQQLRQNVDIADKFYRQATDYYIEHYASIQEDQLQKEYEDRVRDSEGDY